MGNAVIKKLPWFYTEDASKAMYALATRSIHTAFQILILTYRVLYLTVVKMQMDWCVVLRWLVLVYGYPLLTA